MRRSWPSRWRCAAAAAISALVFRTNVDDIVTAGPEHPLRFAVEPASQGLKPYLLVRGRLEALVTRALYYDLVELAVTDGHGFGLWSGGAFFPMHGRLTKNTGGAHNAQRPAAAHHPPQVRAADRDLIAKLAGAQTGHIVDALLGRGALDHRIKPVDPERRSSSARR